MLGYKSATRVLIPARVLPSGFAALFPFSRPELPPNKREVFLRKLPSSQDNDGRQVNLKASYQLCSVTYTWGRHCSQRRLQRGRGVATGSHGTQPGPLWRGGDRRVTGARSERETAKPGRQGQDMLSTRAPSGVRRWWRASRSRAVTVKTPGRSSALGGLLTSPCPPGPPSGLRFPSVRPTPPAARPPPLSSTAALASLPPPRPPHRTFPTRPPG